MRAVRKFFRRFYFLLQRRRLEKELAEEMAIHRDLMPTDRRGTFGNTARLHEQARDVSSWLWTEQLLQDLSYGGRALLRAPAFTLGAIAVLALGIGVNLAEFQIFDSLIFHRLNMPDANSILQFSRASPKGVRLGFPLEAIEFYRKQSSGLAWLVSEDPSQNVVVDGDSDVRSNRVPAGYFASLRIAPAWGRLLNAHDFEPGAPPVAVLGYRYWQTHFASDPNVVGRMVRVNNSLLQIVGVTPSYFDGISPRRTCLWIPEQNVSRIVALYGKLKPGVSQAAAEAELTLLTRELIDREPGVFEAGERIRGELVQGAALSRLLRSPPFFIFVAMILLVLCSACANLGNMMLARGLGRQREIGIRLSLGAGRGRLVRQLMTESVLLAVLGTLAGIAVGAGAANLLLKMLDSPPDMQVPLRWSILMPGVALAFFSAIAFGLPSALQTIRPAARKSALRQTLVGVQVAVSCLLLIASAVLAHNGIAAASVDLAFDYRNMLIVEPQHSGLNLEARLEALPGVRGVTAAVAPPLSGRMMAVSAPGLPRILRNPVAPSYFGLMDLTFLRGRTFLPEERDVVVVSESAARAAWPGQDPLGKVWHLDGPALTVVGVVKDSGANLLADADSIEAYVPIAPIDSERAALIVRAHVDPAPLVRAIPAALASDESVSISLMRAARDNVLESQRRLIILIGSVGAIATVLAAAGMFSLVAFAVAQRKRELGIRLAIGAGARHILHALMAQNTMPMLAGAVAGCALAVILTRLVGSIFVRRQNSPDAAGFAAGLACFAVIALLATVSPAVKALRIDPSETLREE